MATFLDLFTADDSDGAPASSYQLHYLGSAMSNHDSWIFGMATAMVYAAFKAVAVVANGLMGLVLSSASWLDPLSELYQQITAPLYAVVPPWAIACMGLGIVAVSAMRSRPAATTSGLFNSETLDRIGVALALVMGVVVLTHDPFMLITRTMELANGFSVSIAAAVTGSGADTTLTAGQALVDNSIRTPTLALNYGAAFNDSCSAAWSTAMMSGQELSAASGCFAEGQNRAGPDTLFTALLMLIFPALPMLVFAAVAAWKYVLHLSLSVLSVVATAWVAAAAVPRRRGFESLSEMFARAVGHLVMAVVTSMVAVGLPAMVSGFASNVLGLLNIENAAGQAFALMIGLGIGFAVAAWAIVKITAKTGALVRLLKADANITLEKTLGIAPAASMNAVFKQFKTWEWARDEEAKSAASKPLPAPRDAAKKGTDTVPEKVSAADAAAVAALTAPAMALAETAAAPTTTPIDVTVAGSAESRAEPTDADPAELGAAAGAVLDTRGHFTDHSAQAFEVDGDDRAIVTDEESDGVWGESATNADSPAGATVSGPDVDGDRRSVLAGAQTLAMTFTMPTTAVQGNEFADPALDAAARMVGATFVSTGRPPPAPRTLRDMLRLFRPGAPLDPVPFGTPTPVHGNALVLTDAIAATAHSAEAASGAADETVTVNDQATWNRGWRKHLQWARGGSQAVTSPAAEVHEDRSASGLRPGINRNPASYMAPSADFLASAAIESEIEEVGVTLAAAGHPVRITLPPEDNRLALRLSSDPDHRVVRANGMGFGDPF